MKTLVLLDFTRNKMYFVLFDNMLQPLEKTFVPLCLRSIFDSSAVSWFCFPENKYSVWFNKERSPCYIYWYSYLINPEWYMTGSMAFRKFKLALFIDRWLQVFCFCQQFFPRETVFYERTSLSKYRFSIWLEFHK